jgi:hypothetical protein
MAINIFKNVTANLTTVLTTLYTAPAGYSAIVLMAQVSNTTNGPATTTVKVVDVNTAETSLVTGFEIPAFDAAGVLTGKLVLQSGQSIKAAAIANSTLQMVMSILESQN